MQPSRKARAHKAKRQRGAIAVEAALILPIFIVLVFGIIEFGLLFKDWLAVSSSVRAGARVASAEPRVASFGQDSVVNVANEAAALNMGNVRALWVYKAAADGTPVGGSGSFGDCTVCIKYDWDESAKKFVALSDTWPSTSHNACHGDAQHDSVGIYMEIRHDSVTNLIFDGVTIKEHTVMSLEPVPASRGCK